MRVLRKTVSAEGEGGVDRRREETGKSSLQRHSRVHVNCEVPFDLAAVSSTTVCQTTISPNDAEHTLNKNNGGVQYYFVHKSAQTRMLHR